MLTITKKQILYWIIGALLGSGGWLAATESIPEPEPQDFTPILAEQPIADPGEAIHYDDGVSVPAGAHCHPSHDCGWWRRGPVRRVVSAPFRWFRNRRCRWR